MSQIPSLKLNRDIGEMLHSASEMFDAEDFTYVYKNGSITATEWSDEGEVVGRYTITINIAIKEQEA